MKIYIMRHGEAQAFAASDEQRVLTDKGRQQSEAMAKWLASQLPGSQLDAVMVSPYVRAQQTWQSCGHCLPTPNSVETEHDITPYGDSDVVADYVRAYIETTGVTSLLLVSHLPLVGYLTAELVDGGQAPMFPTSSIAAIDYDPDTGKGQLLSMHSPNSIHGFV